jgi:hypothetical protein
MVKTQVYLPAEELAALHREADRTGRSVADLIREAIRRTWLREPGGGPVALWAGPIGATSDDHDIVHDAP